jgi:hypothetical protein
MFPVTAKSSVKGTHQSRHPSLLPSPDDESRPNFRNVFFLSDQEYEQQQWSSLQRIIVNNRYAHLSLLAKSVEIEL